MPVDITLRIDGLKQALEALNIPESEMKARAGKAAALAVIAVAKPYPDQSRKKQPFRSAKSRKYFFAALKSGAIQVPYRRTHALQDGWDWKPDGDGAEVFNSSEHAKWAIDKATRSKYHKGTWKDEEQIAKAAEQDAHDAAETAIVSLVTGLL